MSINKIQEFVPALRMLFSQEQLISARVFESSVKKPESIKELKLNYNDLSTGLSAKHKLPIWVTTQNNESILLADSAATIDNIIDGAKGSVPQAKGRMQGRVVIITGAAQGFGAGIAEVFFKEGANIVIADLNEKAGNEMASTMNSQATANKAYFVKTDVSDAKSVEALVNITVTHFGGLDVMISNAGILRAGGLDEMTPEVFELMTKVNYTGYFNCAKYASAVMKVQSEFTSKYFFDIVQINSKSGLKGSNKNFAYAGGKFGGIGLTQSFALELMPYRTKVNSICPGNFFDGPLWSHPETGLFVQYLKAGKVPGAGNIGDVKAFYEKQVPAGRGCEVMDVVRAIYYAIEQEYETGQAIPVTGGQNMLH